MICKNTNAISRHVSSPKERRVFFSFFAFFADVFDPFSSFLPLSLSGRLSSSNSVAFRLLDLNFADEEEENESPFEDDASVLVLEELGSDVLSSIGFAAVTKLASASGSGGRPFSRKERKISLMMTYALALCPAKSR